MYNYKILIYDYAKGEEPDSGDPYCAEVSVPSKMLVGALFEHWDRDMYYEITEVEDRPVLYVDYDNQSNSKVYTVVVARPTEKMRW